MYNPQLVRTKELLSSLVRQYGPRIRLLPCKPEENAESTVRALWHFAAGVQMSSVKAMHLPLSELSESQIARLTGLLEQRAQGIPLAYLTGRQHFMGLECLCDPTALIPRQETELLGRAACRILLEQVLPTVKEPRVLDLCTGCGNLACAVASQVPESTVFASDLSPEAAALARKNAAHLGCGDRIRVFVGDLFGPFDPGQYNRSFDLILCNPPYISTATLPRMEAEIVKHEPKLALDAGHFGLGILSRLLRDAPAYAKPGGWLAFEVGRGQGSGMMRRLSRDGRFGCLKPVQDEQNNVRAVAAQIAFYQSNNSYDSNPDCSHINELQN